MAMPSFFNPIAIALPVESRFQDRLLNFAGAHRLPYSLACPACGGEFAVYVPAVLVSSDVKEIYGDLTNVLTATCGRHPPVIQRQ
jgi:hypothetical protein